MGRTTPPNAAEEAKGPLLGRGKGPAVDRKNGPATKDSFFRSKRWTFPTAVRAAWLDKRVWQRMADNVAFRQ